MEEREATKYIGPGQPVTDENSIGIDAVLHRRMEGVLFALAGLDGPESQQVRDALASMPAVSMPKVRPMVAMLVTAVHVARAKTWEQQEQIEHLEADARGVRNAHQNAQEDLAALRVEFAAEVQRNQNLQHRLMQSSEAALQTINNLVDRLP